jgi:hypothetical protein
LSVKVKFFWYWFWTVPITIISYSPARDVSLVKTEKLPPVGVSIKFIKAEGSDVTPSDMKLVYFQ